MVFQLLPPCATLQSMHFEAKFYQPLHSYADENNVSLDQFCRPSMYKKCIEKMQIKTINTLHCKSWQTYKLHTSSWPWSTNAHVLQIEIHVIIHKYALPNSIQHLPTANIILVSMPSTSVNYMSYERMCNLKLRHVFV